MHFEEINLHIVGIFFEADRYMDIERDPSESQAT